MTLAEDLDESLAKLSTHGAVEYEVDGVVQQGHDVEQVAERPIDVLEEILDEDAAESEHSLWQLRYEEETDDCQQHGRRPIVFPRTVRFVLPSLRLQLHAPDVGLMHGYDQQDGQYGQQDARNQLE